MSVPGHCLSSTFRNSFNDLSDLSEFQPTFEVRCSRTDNVAFTPRMDLEQPSLITVSVVHFKKAKVAIL